MKKHAAPIFAALLLLLPVLYVGSYLALVVPELGKYNVVESPHGNYYHGYRNGGDWAWRLFWPLEQFDRKVRSREWELPDDSPQT